MAHIINRFVMHGRFDNRQRDLVKVRLWFQGMKGPVEFELQGNFHADIAGSCIVFRNKEKSIHVPEVFSVLQQNHYVGETGDMTACKNVWVPCISSEGKFDSRLARRISFEWFLPDWGRFLLEGDSFKVRMCEPAWRMESWEESVQLLENKLRLRDYISAVKFSLWRISPEEELLPWYSSKLLRKQQQSTDILNTLHSELEAKYGEDDNAEAEIAFAMSWNHILEAAAFNEETGDSYFESQQEEDFWMNPDVSINDFMEENERVIASQEPVYEELETLATQIHEWVRGFTITRDPSCPVYKLLSEYSFVMQKVPLVTARMRRGEPDSEKLLEPLRKARAAFKSASHAFNLLAVPSHKLLHMSIMQRWSDLGRNMEMLYESIRHRG